jgi:beta-glucanase (GH16 family)
MITIEPPSPISVPCQNPGSPTNSGGPPFALLAKGGLSSEPGSPASAFARWGGEARPSSSKSKRTLTIVCLLLLAIPIATQAQSTNWQLTWSDEFNAPSGSPPDPAKWNIVTGGKGFGNNELETYTARPANIQQQNGNLVITAQKEDLTGPDGIPRHYTSARLNTQTRFAQTYGRFEARIQLPTGKGIWPAFWLLGDNHETAHWPNCGEIDILETIGAPDTMYSTLHGPGYSGGKGISAKFPLPTGESVNTAFHLYAVEWSPNDIKFFFDDHLVAHRTPADLPPNTTWVYDHPFYILLNLAVGGKWPGNPDDTTTLPQHMLIDYVRVYSRKPEHSQAATKPGAPYIAPDVWASSAGRPSSPAPATKQGGPSFALLAKGGLSSEAKPSSASASNSRNRSKPTQ